MGSKAKRKFASTIVILERKKTNDKPLVSSFGYKKTISYHLTLRKNHS